MKNKILISFYMAVSIMAILFLRPNSPHERDKYTLYLKEHPYSSVQDQCSIDEISKKDRPDLAMQQNFLMIMDPETKSVPTERLVRAFEKQKSVRKHSNEGIEMDAIPGVIWQERGPNNVGGRTRALMWDPNDANNRKLWAAGVAGGIWFNNDVTDENSSWQNVNDFMANLAVTTLTYDPTNTQVFYAGTGEGFFNSDAVRGAGIFKTTDGGNTWNLLASTENSTFHYVQKVVVSNNGTILAATRNNGVQRSTDGGTSWSTVLNSSTTGASSSRATDIELAQNGDIYASLGIFSAGSVHLSTNDGETWSPITPPGGSPERIELAVSPSSSSVTNTTVLYAVASNGNNVEWFQKSNDGGTSWTNLTIPQYREQNCSTNGQDFTRGQAWYDLILGVHPTDADIVFAGGINVLKSSNGGTSMSEISYWTGGCDTYVHADIHAFAFRPNNPDELVVGSDGGVSYSTNAGSSSDPTFNDRNKNYNVTQFYAVAAQNSDGVSYYLAGAQDNGTQRFNDAGGFSTFEVTGGDGAFCFIDQDDNNLQISSFVRNVYYLLNSTGGFVQTLSNDQSSGRFINPADYDNSLNILYSAGLANELKRISGIASTPNSQETIALSLNGEQISALRADAYTSDRIFIGTGSGGVYRIDNASQTTPSIVEITNNITQAGYVSSIDLGSSDNEIIITFSNYGASSIWYSVDGGANWINKDDDGSLPDIPVRWALFNPNNSAQVLLATELGVWSTNNITSTEPGWTQSSNNLANVRCDMLQYRSADSQVIVATHGRGVFTSNVFGGADIDQPIIISLSPANDESETRLDIPLEISFNEAINVGTGNITITDVNNATVFETIDITSNQVGFSGNSVTIDPIQNFETLTNYEVSIDAGAIVDVSGNEFDGILTWSFTTFDGDEPPIVSQSIPNQFLTVGSEPFSLDLSEYFEDQDDEVIIYSVFDNDNDALITTSISDNIITLTLQPGEVGIATLTIRATSNAKFIDQDVFVVINQPILVSQQGVLDGTSPSQVFPDFSNSELETADDFIIPEGGNWTIYSVSVNGASQGDIPIEGIFRIYDDLNGEPGSVVMETPISELIKTTDDDNFQIQLSSPLELSEGRYWLAVLDVQNFDGVSGNTQWFWEYTVGGNGYKRRDPDQLLGGSWSVDWQNGTSGKGMIFEIYGTEPVNTPSEISLSESQDGVLIEWIDNADNELNYIIERSIGDEDSYTQIASLPSNTTFYVDNEAATNSINYYKLRAVAAEDASGILKGNILTVPDRPVLVDVTNVEYNGYTINWESSDGADEFILDISTANDFTTFLSGFEELEVFTTFQLVNNVESTTFFFRVAAANASGMSAFSDVGTVTLEPLSTPLEEAISVYPNPGNGIYNINGITSNGEVMVMDLSGKQIPFRYSENVLDISEVQDGSYIIRVQNDGKTSAMTIIKK